MQVWLFTLLVAMGSFVAGFLGALTGLGGGVVVVPLLVLGFGVDMPYAIGASLVSVIATSSGAASAFVRQGFSNLRLAMVLEIPTTAGALLGAFLVTLAVVPVSALSALFGLALLASAVLSIRQSPAQAAETEADPLASFLRLHGQCPTPEGDRPYRVDRLPLGCASMFAAGVLSGLLGIGSGAVNVVALDRILRVPFKVATTTSNLMIGVTAAASAGVYFGRGYIAPELALPVVLGVLLGSSLGARALRSLDPKVLRVVFAVVIFALGLQMLGKTLFGGAPS